MPWVEMVAGVVEAYYPGMENGNAVIRVLLGEVNPSGKLPVTFPKRLQDSPAFINASYPGCREVNYGEGIFVGYRYFEKVEISPLFPFGHGLSYTDFNYSKLSIPKRCKRGNNLEVSMDVTNKGDRDGAEVVQLYVRDIASFLVRPVKELKGFEKVFLKSGETKTITFVLDERALTYYDPYYMKWIAEPGEFEVLLGSSSKDIRLRGKFVLIE
jgi:beta-glucosidase